MDKKEKIIDKPKKMNKIVNSEQKIDRPNTSNKMYSKLIDRVEKLNKLKNVEKRFASIDRMDNNIDEYNEEEKKIFAKPNKSKVMQATNRLYK